MWSKEQQVVNGTKKTQRIVTVVLNDLASGDIHVPKPFIVLKTGGGHRRGGLDQSPRRERWGVSALKKPGVETVMT